FLRRAREMAVAGSGAGGSEPPPFDPQALLDEVRPAMAAGVSPGSAEGREVLDRLISPDMPAAERVRLADQVERFTDRRVERYWQLLGLLNGTPPFEPGVPAFEWFIAALRAHGQVAEQAAAE